MKSEKHLDTPNFSNKDELSFGDSLKMRKESAPLDSYRDSQNNDFDYELPNIQDDYLQNTDNATKSLDVSGLVYSTKECQTDQFEAKNQELEDFAGEILNDRKELDDIVSSLENCGYCSTMLLNLINDLMDLAKLEKMKFSLNNSFFDLTKTIKGAFGTLSYFGK